MKKIIYALVAVVIIIIAIVVYWVGFSAGEITGEVKADPNMEFVSGEEAFEMEKCEAVNLELKSNPRVKIVIDKTDENQSDNVVKNNMLKDTYSLDELGELSYGFTIKEDKNKEPLYTIAEICDGDKTLSFANLEILDNEEAVAGILTQFNNKQPNGVVERTIDKPGEYQLYVYASDNKQNWYIAKKFDFSVK